MIDLRQALNEAMRNIPTWRLKYPSHIYPHKIVLNMMYRAYSTRMVYEAFINDEMVEFEDFNEAFYYVMQFYADAALHEVHPKLEYWMATNPNEQVGSLCTARYEALATKAEADKSALEELEFSYAFELVNDMCVLYYIAFRLNGLNDVDAISKMTDTIIESIPNMDYAVVKQVFQQLIVARFMHLNYHRLPE